MCYPISSLGAHVAARPRTSLKTRGNVAMCGTFGYELDPRKLTDDEKAEVKQQIADYRKYHRLSARAISTASSPRPRTTSTARGSSFRPDKQEAMMTAVVMRQPETRYCVQRLRGLDPKTYYQDEETGTVYSGAMLMNAGLNLTRDVYEDGTSVTKHFKAVK